MMIFIIPSFILSLFGIFNIFGIKQSIFLNQLLYVFIAFCAYFVIRKIGRNFFEINSAFFYWFFFLILIATFVIGLEVKGSKRWIDFYFLRFQTSEFFKIFLILHLSNFFASYKKYSNELVQFIQIFLYFAVPTFIIFKQPDLGNAMVYFVIYSAMLIFSFFPKRYIIYLFIFVALILPGGWFFLKGYQKERILSFFNPHLDKQGTSYNMIQSVITVGSGGFFGRGLGLGTQSKLFFLPENHTDFAFASLVEQFGFIGGFAIIFLYFLIIVSLIKKLFHYFYNPGEESEKKFLYIVGFLSYFVFQIIVNIGMNMGLLPITGIALPFISYGGSSILAFMIGMALLP